MVSYELICPQSSQLLTMYVVYLLIAYSVWTKRTAPLCEQNKNLESVFWLNLPRFLFFPSSCVIHRCFGSVWFLLRVFNRRFRSRFGCCRLSLAALSAWMPPWWRSTSSSSRTACSGLSATERYVADLANFFGLFSCERIFVVHWAELYVVATLKYSTEILGRIWYTLSSGKYSVFIWLVEYFGYAKMLANLS